MRQKSVRCIFVRSPNVLRFTGASDAAYEQGKGTGGFLLALLGRPEQQARLGRYTQITSDVYAKWEPAETYIAQLELLMVYLALMFFAEHFRGRRGIWFIDNIAALMALVRGRSRHEDLDNLAGPSTPRCSPFKSGSTSSGSSPRRTGQTASPEKALKTCGAEETASQ